MWNIGGELKHFGVMGQKWGIRRYQNADGTLTEEGKKRYTGSNAKKNFVEDYKDTYPHNPVTYVNTVYGPAEFRGNESTYGTREIEYVKSQKEQAKAFRQMHKDFAKAEEKTNKELQDFYRELSEKKISSDVYHKKLTESITKFEDYGKKFIKEKYKDVLKMESDDFKNMMAVNMIWMSESFNPFPQHKLNNGDRVHNANTEQLIQIYKNSYGKELEKRW